MGCDLLEILETNGPRLFAVLARLTMSEHVAEDLLQDLFIKLSKGSQLTAAVDPVAYTHKTAINLALDWRRCRKPTMALTTTDIEKRVGNASPLEGLAQKEEIQRILDAAVSLSDLLREAFTMRYVEQRSYEEIGHLLGKTPHQARAICAKATVKIRAAMSNTVSLADRRGG